MMSENFGRLVDAILHDVFGDIIKEVAHVLFKFGSRNLSSIATQTGIPLDKVRKALSVLIQHGLVKFSSRETVPHLAEYSLHSEKVLLFIRYPRYMLLIKSLLGGEEELLIDELLRYGSDTASNLLIRSGRRLLEAANGDKSSVSMKDICLKFKELVGSHFIQRCPALAGDDSSRSRVPNFIENEFTAFSVPDIDLNTITSIVFKEDSTKKSVDNDKVFWTVNFDRFHLDFRDDLLIAATKRRIDDHAGTLVGLLLAIVKRSENPWGEKSISIRLTDIKAEIKKQGLTGDIVDYLEQYLKVIEEDSFRLVSKCDLSGDGTYRLDFANAIELLTWSTLENIILERYGSKSARIFRIIKTRKNIEQDQIQELAMIPAKEAKALTYELLASNFIQVKELGKGGMSAGVNKVFFLFHIDLNLVVRMVLEMCYKSLHNILIRKDYESSDNRRLIEKQQRIESIILSLKEQGGTEEQLQEIEEMLTTPERNVLEKIQRMSDKLAQSETFLDETIFILQLQLHFEHKK